MKEEEMSISFLGCFDDEEKKVAEILGQFPELVVKYEYNRGILPFWSSKALRSVLVNITLPSKRSSQPQPPPPPPPSLPTLPRSESSLPVTNALPSIPQSLPSSSKITMKKKRQHLRILKDEAVEESHNMFEEDAIDEKEAEGRLCREQPPLSEGFRPLPDWILIPKQTLLMGYCIQPIQLSKKAVYAEARRRRKLEMQRVKTSNLPRT